MNDLDQNIENDSEEKKPENMEEIDNNIQVESKPGNEIEEVSQDIDEVEEPIINEEEMLKRQLKDFNKNLIEAALFAAGKALSIEELNVKLEIPKKEIEELINKIAFDYLERSTALIVNQIGEKYQMALKPEYVEKVSKFATGGLIAERYLRTLTVIALKQPILKSLVIKIRGTGAYEHVKYLLDQEFITAIKKGRSQELTTTDKYAEMFGLPKDINQMKEIMISQLDLESLTSDNSDMEEE
ncbi:MAG: SMC-Scp complex subunit ScpB [Candidatus Hermodarchaeota archaeon]